MCSSDLFNFEEIELGKGGHSLSLLAAVSGAATTPQVFVDGELLGGADQLATWLQTIESTKLSAQ